VEVLATILETIEFKELQIFTSERLREQRAQNYSTGVRIFIDPVSLQIPLKVSCSVKKWL